MTGIRLRTGAPRRAPASPPPPPPSLRSQSPGSGALAASLAEHAAAPPRSRLGRFAGLAPLGAPAAAWYERARIERDAADLLRRLPADWTVLHSVPLDGPVVPHLLVGPAGVFALFPEPRPRASVWVSADLLSVDGAGSDAVAAAESVVPAIRERLAAVLRGGVPVVPIVAFPAPERVVVRTPPTSARVLPLEDVVPWLRSLREVCSAVIVDRIADAAAVPETWGAEGPLDDGFGALQAELAEADRRWARTVRAIVAGSPALLAAGAAVGALVLGAFFAR
ncbi:nuclease-related domain-containing protein [Naasia sp. SYSU D00948]|uniref:nuclease-related domain-containing protein n=1 Tax=Naasia sp. SYSU D00948 TaxID=2817379 RepID=UPI001B30BE56|nr:nuclease-related domain-containing protein [Naasia sp. SYSU D00948]